MDSQQRNALAGALQAGPPAPPMQPGPPGPPPPGGDAPMSPDQAMQLLQSLGITPDNMPMVIQAISVVMDGGGAGGAGMPPPGAPPPGAPPPQ